MASQTRVQAPWRIEVFRKPHVDDPEGTHAKRAIQSLAQGRPGLAGIEEVRMGRGFLLPPSLDADQVAAIVTELLADPVVDDATTYEPGQVPAARGLQRVLVARKPGVMDPVAQTLGRSLQRIGIWKEAGEPWVQSFLVWQVRGTVAAADLLELGRRLWANEVIEELRVGDETLPYGVPPARPRTGRVEVHVTGLDDGQLLELSTSGQLYLNLAEMHCVRDHYRAAGREPSACELETIAQTWSEHCQHKTFRGNIDFEGEHIENLLKTTIAAATHEIDHPMCVSVFHDNAGIIEFDPDVAGGMDVAIKVETHNHPSAIDPYGGAGTGIGGVIRDILGVGRGAHPIANMDAFFVGPQDLPAEEVPKGSLHPARILHGVVAGVRDYGNRMGIPTVSGGVWFDKRYTANPLVYAGTIGLIPRKFATKEVQPGDAILVVGGRTGRDGIHGATFSSVELDEESEMVSAAAVQIGDPITGEEGRRSADQARDQELFPRGHRLRRGRFVLGDRRDEQTPAPWCTSSACRSKYPGLTPDEIWISEAQERMVLAVPPAQLDACIAVFAAEDVEATVLGEFSGTGRLVLQYEGEVVGDLDLAFLHGGTPKPLRKATWTRPNLPDPGAPVLEDPKAALLGVLARPGIASKEWIVRQYDHNVQGGAVIEPMSGVRQNARPTARCCIRCPSPSGHWPWAAPRTRATACSTPRRWPKR
ncbi:MAG: phosphoribosylformylglycinamidine synthase subunit PurS [Planctomycetota bacterium]